MLERDSLIRIRSLYGAFLDAAALLHSHRPEVLAGIMQRETEGGLSRYLDVQGPSGRGDFGHGHGLMQIDDRSFPDFIISGQWRIPEHNINFAASILSRKRRYLADKPLEVELSNAELERATIAAYNCGEGNVMKAIREHGRDLDYFTAHHNYSAEVLRLAEIYRDLT